MNQELEAALAKEFPFMRRDRQNTVDAYQKFGIEAGPGWYELIRSLCRELADLCAQAGREDDLMVRQVKEKFGKLRFYCYLENGTKEEDTALYRKIYDVTDKYGELSTQVCELCGAPGELRQLKLRSGMAWYQTLCGEHYALRQKQLNP